jgi:lambda repressor-like predicted transcriptional regulator
MEEYYAEQYAPYMWDTPGGYNMVWAGSGGRLGIPHSEETIAKMKNREVTDETKQRMREGAETRWTDEYKTEWGQKMRDRDPDIVTTDTTRALISESLRKRALAMTPEQKAAQYSKISGENCKTSKLTGDDVIRIRALRKEGKTLAELSVAFGVSKATMSRVCRGDTWKSIPS